MNDFEKVLNLCESENMYAEMKKSELDDLLYEYFNELYKELEKKSVDYKTASNTKNKIMRENETLWNVVENEKVSALTADEVKKLIEYLDALKGENYEASFALYLQGVKDCLNGKFSLDFSHDPLMSHRALELVVELAKETGKSIDEIANFVYNL